MTLCGGSSVVECLSRQGGIASSSPNMFYVYILQSTINGTYYIGQTKDIETRLRQHNSMTENCYTKKFAPYLLIYQEEHLNRSEAIRREKLIKSYKGGEAFKKLVSK